MALSKPSAHRCMILKLSRLLSREDVSELLFLSEDFIPQSEVEQISCGVDLMRSLERHGRLSPAKYDYLLVCLKEVGRLDLVINLTEFIFSNLLEFPPCGFIGQSQMYIIKIRILQIKQRRYLESMQGLQIAASRMDFWEEWGNSVFQSIVYLNLTATVEEVSPFELNPIMALSKPSAHRCTILKLSRLLSREDVSELLFLSEDFIPQSEVEQISSGVDLMRSLERHGRLSPAKYDYLLACLKEIGRFDLVINLTEFIFSNLLEFLPSGFKVPSQMYAIKIRILKIKQRRYVESMQGLQIVASNTDFWEEWCNSAFQSIVSCATSSACMSEVVDFPQILLESAANISMAWMDAAAGFQEGSSKNETERKLEDIRRHKRNLYAFLDLGQNGLNGITLWSKQPEHLDHAMSVASAALVDLLSELLGHSADSEHVQKLLTTLAGIRAITPEGYSMEMVTQSLLILTKMAVNSSLERSSCEQFLKSLLSQLRNVITCCRGSLLKIFHGTKLAKKTLDIEIELLEHVHETDEFHLPSFDVSICPILFTMLACLLALFYSSELNPDQWQQIRMQLFQFLRERSQPRISFLVTLVSHVCVALQSELDNFRNTSLTEFVKMNFGKNDRLWNLLTSIFQY